MIAENILEKYIKVWTLADSGAPEAHAARKIMQSLESKYGGIRSQAEALRTAMNGQYATHTPQPRSEPWNREEDRPDWRKMASSAFNFASQYAYQAFGAMEAEKIAQQVRVEGRQNQTGSMSIIARFDVNLLNYANLLTPMQKEMIAGLLAERIKHQIIYELSKK